MAAKKEDTKVETVVIDEETKATVNCLAATVRKVVKALECKFGIDIDRDGKVGSTRLGALYVLFGISLIGAIGATTIVQYYDGDAKYGTYKVVSDDAGTATLTVDAVAANVSGTTLAATGNITGGAFIIGGTQSASITTNDSTLTVTDNNVYITSSVVTTTALQNVSVAGVDFTLINVGTNAVVIEDSSNVESSGALTLGQYDAVTFHAYTTSNLIQVTAVENN